MMNMVPRRTQTNIFLRFGATAAGCSASRITIAIASVYSKNDRKLNSLTL